MFDLKIIRTVILSNLLMLSSLLALIGNAHADPDPSWLNATAETRATIDEFQQQANKNNAQQAKKQGMQQQKLQESLDAIIEQQKVLMKNTDDETTAQSEVPVFAPRPRTPAKSNNPYLKPNPWGNTTKNPYKGKKYVPNSSDYKTDGIYVKPSEKNGSESKPVDIFK